MPKEMKTRTICLEDLERFARDAFFDEDLPVLFENLAQSEAIFKHVLGLIHVMYSDQDSITDKTRHTTRGLDIVRDVLGRVQVKILDHWRTFTPETRCTGATVEVDDG